MDGYQYEHACAKYLKKKGYYKIQVTQKSGDQGVDILAHKGPKKYAIQCKLYSKPVGNYAVQQAYAGAKYYNCDQGIVITNQKFTPSAIELAESNDVILFEDMSVDYMHRDGRAFTVRMLNLISMINMVLCIFGGYYYQQQMFFLLGFLSSFISLTSLYTHYKRNRMFLAVIGVLLTSIVIGWGIYQAFGNIKIAYILCILVLQLIFLLFLKLN